MTTERDGVRAVEATNRDFVGPEGEDRIRVGKVTCWIRFVSVERERARLIGRLQ